MLDNTNKVEIDGYPVQQWWLNGSRRKKSGYRHLKLYLLDLLGVCYHCGTTVRDYIRKDHESLPDDAATIDHLMPRQIRKRYQVTPKVLSCHKCNQDLNEVLTKEGLRYDGTPHLVS
jgi:hypothetical protein